MFAMYTAVALNSIRLYVAVILFAQGRHVDVALGPLQQYIGPSGKLPGELRPSAHGRTGLRVRRQCLPEHLSNEAVHLWVSRPTTANPNSIWYYFSPFFDNSYPGLMIDVREGGKIRRVQNCKKLNF